MIHTKYKNKIDDYVSCLGPDVTYKKHTLITWLKIYDKEIVNMRNSRNKF